MGFMTKKREMDLVSILAIAFFSVILTLFSAWLYYSPKVDKMKSSYSFKVELLKDKLEYYQIENKKLTDEITKVKELEITNADSVSVKTLGK